jgi:hypothetical protein
MAGAVWNANGKRHENEVAPFTKYVLKPIHAESE